MPKRLGSSEIIRVLQKHGFAFATQKGSHAKYKNRHRAASEERTAYWHHAIHYPPVGPDPRGFWFLMKDN